MSNRPRGFHGECHKSPHHAGHVYCELVTDDPALFVAHVKNHPRHGAYDTTGFIGATPAWVRDAGKPWRAPRSNKPWQPKAFDVGDAVMWVMLIEGLPLVMSGQVWSNHPAPRTRWVVSEQRAYAVQEGVLTTCWLESSRNRLNLLRTSADAAAECLKLEREIDAIEKQVMTKLIADDVAQVFAEVAS